MTRPFATQARQTLMTLFIVVFSCGLYHGNEKPILEPPGDVAVELDPQAKQGLSLLLELESAAVAGKLSNAGFISRFCFQNYCTGDISQSNLDRLLQTAGVRTARFLGTSHATVPSRPGQRIVVGVIDEGIYWRDFSFWEPSGRIQWLWDQKKAENKGHVPYGQEFTGTELQSLRELRDQLPSEFGHGFPTAIVSAGFIPGHLVTKETGFPDIPSSTPIIFVNTTGRSDDILDAVAYVISKAREINARAVINLSFGGHFGPHDGSDTFTRALDALIGEDAVLVLAAGNDGQRSTYAQFSGNPAVAELTVSNCIEEDASFSVEGWYDSSAGGEVTVSDPANQKSDTVSNDDISGWRGAAYGGVLDHRLRSANARNRGFALLVEGKCAGLTGKWKLQLHNRNGTNLLDVWLTNNKNVNVQMQHAAGGPPGFSAVAASTRAISAGAYTTDTQNKSFDLDADSGWGSTRTGISKPDVLAPGHVRFYAAGVGDHPTASGTSIAAAMTTRCVVHLWSAHPALTARELRQRLRNAILLPISGLNWKNNTQFKPDSCE